jgi:hypothetical protein
MTLENVKNEWKEDTRIDQTKLNDEIVKTPRLHAKYLDYFIIGRAKRSELIKKINIEKNFKRKYYRGELTKEELLERALPQWQGLKPSASELKDLFDQDPDICELNQKLDYWNIYVETIEYIMKSIGSRGYDLRALFELRKFESGA